MKILYKKGDSATYTLTEGEVADVIYAGNNNFVYNLISTRDYGLISDPRPGNTYVYSVTDTNNKSVIIDAKANQDTVCYFVEDKTIARTQIIPAFITSEEFYLYDSLGTTKLILRLDSVEEFFNVQLQEGNVDPPSLPVPSDIETNWLTYIDPLAPPPTGFTEWSYSAILYTQDLDISYVYSLPSDINYLSYNPSIDTSALFTEKTVVPTSFSVIVQAKGWTTPPSHIWGDGGLVVKAVDNLTSVSGLESIFSVSSSSEYEYYLAKIHSFPGNSPWEKDYLLSPGRISLRIEHKEETPFLADIMGGSALVHTFPEPVRNVVLQIYRSYKVDDEFGSNYITARIQDKFGNLIEERQMQAYGSHPFGTSYTQHIMFFDNSTPAGRVEVDYSSAISIIYVYSRRLSDTSFDRLR